MRQMYNKLKTITMKPFKDILDSIEVVNLEDDKLTVKHHKVGTFVIKRKVSIDNMTLLPCMDVIIKTPEGMYLGGFGSGFLTNEEIIQLNKLFIQVDNQQEREKSKVMRTIKDDFWKALD